MTSRHMWFSPSLRFISSIFSMSFTCIGVPGVMTLIPELSDGTTEFLVVRLCLGGLDKAALLSVGVVTGYSSRFHLKNSLILPIAFLLLIGVWIKIDSKLKGFATVFSVNIVLAFCLSLECCYSVSFKRFRKMRNRNRF